MEPYTHNTLHTKLGVTNTHISTKEKCVNANGAFKLLFKQAHPKHVIVSPRGSF